MRRFLRMSARLTGLWLIVRKGLLAWINKSCLSCLAKIRSSSLANIIFLRNGIRGQFWLRFILNLHMFRWRLLGHWLSYWLGCWLGCWLGRSLRGRRHKLSIRSCNGFIVVICVYRVDVLRKSIECTPASRSDVLRNFLRYWLIGRLKGLDVFGWWRLIELLNLLFRSL